MVDRNTAFYFLDKNETGRFEWFVTSIIQWNIAWLTWVNDSDDEVLEEVVNSFLWILYISPRNILLFMSDIYSDAINSF